MELHENRLKSVEFAVERAESMRLCIGAPSTERQLQLNSGDGISRQRDLAGIESGWLVEAIAETNDGDNLELGDSVRLLTHVVTQESHDDSIQSDLAITGDKWVSFCTMCSPFLNINAETLMEEGIEWIHEIEEAVLHYFIGKNAKVAGPVADMARGACSPLLLEILMQRMFAYVDDGSTVEDLVGEVLWEHCGWDSPQGRRLVRRLQRIFDRYTSGHKISKASFVKLCSDADLTSHSNSSLKTAQLCDFFNEVAGDKHMVNFADFLYLMELAAGEVHQQEVGLISGVWRKLQEMCCQICGNITCSTKTRNVGPSALTVRPKSQKLNNQKTGPQGRTWRDNKRGRISVNKVAEKS